ncbi:MAG: TMEM165/GDT1 family protein [Halolamina sp.]|uniref:TMEM165/GDT1 family protein n=1 Tax=Halolamina sp. TaxID=1940283 RepID=UPI002FC3CB0F
MGVAVAEPAVRAVPLQSGLDIVVQRYSGHGPLIAAFLANLLATFGDKGQLVVVTLASRYDTKKVFLGAMGAFTLWSGVEVILGQYVVTVLPDDVVTLITGGLFILFGLWTLSSAVAAFRAEVGVVSSPFLRSDLGVGVSGWLLPDRVFMRLGTHGGTLTAFLFVLFAEFGDKTQLLTINLAATFPDAPISVFLGVIGALGLRTGVDAVIGERVEQAVPTKYIELGASTVFLAFGLVVLGLVPESFLLGVLGTLLVLGIGGLLRRWRHPTE